MDHVNYSALDTAKNAFIEASRLTLGFAKKYGFVPGKKLGGSANVFSLDITGFLKSSQTQLHLTHLCEGLGTADEARPEDLTDKETLEFWKIIGRKTVAVMSNDAASSGMQTLLLSLYLPSSDPELVFSPPFMKGFLKGIVEACRQVGCVYFSGETPQLKTKIVSGKLDIAGSVFGIMPEKVMPIDGSMLAPGDLMVFVESTGPNENGFTTLRGLAKKLPEGYRTKLPSGVEYWRAIQNPPILYTALIQDILQNGVTPTALQPITGHGWQKIMRSEKSLRYLVEDMLPVPEIFAFIQRKLGISTKEMMKVFNYGLGLVVFANDMKSAEKIVSIAKKHKLKAIIGGRVEKSQKREVLVEPLNITLKGDDFLLKQK